MPNRVVHFEIPTKNIKRASNFYSQAFGWKMIPQSEEYGGYVVAQSGDAMPNLKDWGINGGLYEEEPNDNIKAFRCVIAVDDIEKAVKDVKNAGGSVYNDNKTPDGKPLGEIMDIPAIGKFAKCEDTEGNMFSLLQPSPMMNQSK